FLCLGEVNGIYLKSESLDSIGPDVLPDRTVNVSFQFLRLIPATTIDDMSSKHDWKSAGLLGQTLKVPGQLVQPLDPSLSIADGVPFYLFESHALRILTASLFEQLTPQKRLLRTVVSVTKFFPYRERGGTPNLLMHSSLAYISGCEYLPRLPPNTPLDPHQGQQVLGHNAAHILFDPKIDRTTDPCGACLNPAPMCEFYMATGNKKINKTRSKCPNAGMKFRYSTAAKLTPSAPSSNDQIVCALCGAGTPTVWRYNYLNHLRSAHPSAPEAKYAEIWRLEGDETTNVKKIWDNITKGVPIPKKREPKAAPLVISEAHSSRLSMG
ncbi:hypothetical protein B0H14DRAFT_2422248, partial [Mycena olivaceomarginata]